MRERDTEREKESTRARARKRERERERERACPPEREREREREREGARDVGERGSPTLTHQSMKNSGLRVRSRANLEQISQPRPNCGVGPFTSVRTYRTCA